MNKRDRLITLEWAMGDRTMSEVAAAHSISAKRVRQIITRAVNELQANHDDKPTIRAKMHSLIMRSEYGYRCERDSPERFYHYEQQKLSDLEHLWDVHGFTKQGVNYG